VTVAKLKGWVTTMRTELGRVRRKLKGKSGSSQSSVRLTERENFRWTNLRFLADRIQGRTYVDETQVGICIQLLDMLWVVCGRCIECSTISGHLLL